MITAKVPVRHFWYFKKYHWHKCSQWPCKTIEASSSSQPEWRNAEPKLAQLYDRQLQVWWLWMPSMQEGEEEAESIRRERWNGWRFHQRRRDCYRDDWIERFEMQSSIHSNLIPKAVFSIFWTICFKSNWIWQVKIVFGRQNGALLYISSLVPIHCFLLWAPLCSFSYSASYR
jgi:hypothetical protein